jgi:hypothetical protein
MLHHPDDVLIDLAGRCLCPIHGPQPGEYEAGRAACGCQWVALKSGLLRCEPAQSCGMTPYPATALATNGVAPLAEMCKM